MRRLIPERTTDIESVVLDLDDRWLMDSRRQGSIEGQCYWIQTRKLVQCTKEYDHIVAVRAQLRSHVSALLQRSGNPTAMQLGKLLEAYVTRTTAGRLSQVRSAVLAMPWCRINLPAPKDKSVDIQRLQRFLAGDAERRVIYFIRTITGVDDEVARFSVGLERFGQSLISSHTANISNLMSYAERTLGWVRVHGEFVSCYSWDEPTLKRLRTGLRQICDRHGVVAEQCEWHIGLTHPKRKNYYAVPLFTLNRAEDLFTVMQESRHY